VTSHLRPTNAANTALPKKPAARVLVLDDEPDLRTLYELTLLSEGYWVDSAADVSEARAILSRDSFDVFITDMRLPDGLGLELVLELASQKRPERCIVITAYGSAENAVKALKAGAFDYLTKPVDIQRLRQVVRDAMLGPAANPAPPVLPVATGPSPRPSPPLQLSDAAEYALGLIVGQSQRMLDLKAMVVKVSGSMAPVLVTGESGTGKELVARALHACSHRASGPFVAVNCAAIPESLVEAEFFGALKGSYTGATADRPGHFQTASGGTLFLDELGELPLAMQSKLLRAIQERHVRPLGASQELPVDVRIVSATHQSLQQAVAAGRFRQDLYYRINVIELAIAPLRERREDLPDLCTALLARVSGQLPGKTVLSQNSLAGLQQLPLAGNVRELENLLHRAWALSDSGELDLGLPAASEPSSRSPAQSDALEKDSTKSEKQAEAPEELPKDLAAYLEAQERKILLNALVQHRFNRTTAAQQVGISLRQMRYRIVRLGIDVPQETSEDGFS
jgi:two-component system, NtrC family, response regulator PilR